MGIGYFDKGRVLEPDMWVENVPEDFTGTKELDHVRTIPRVCR